MSFMVFAVLMSIAILIALFFLTIKLRRNE
jgi:hypothetical protein